MSFIKYLLPIAAFPLLFSGCTLRIVRVQDVRNNKDFVAFLSKRSVKVVSTYSCKSILGETVFYKNGNKANAHKFIRIGGTGVIVKSSKSGGSYILTAAHVVEPTEGNYLYSCKLYGVVVRRYDINGNQTDSASVKVVLYNRKIDLALLKTTYNFGVNTKIVNDVYLGQSVHSLGFPTVLANEDRQKDIPVYTYGNVAVKKVKSGGRYLIRVTAVIYFGNSGGPIYDNDGKVVGISVLLYTSGSHREYYGVSYEEIRGFLNRSKYKFLLK